MASTFGGINTALTCFMIGLAIAVATASVTIGRPGDDAPHDPAPIA